MATHTWTGTSSSDFGTAGNWSPGGEPGIGDIVIIGAGATVDFTATAGNSIEVFNELQLAAGALLTVNSGDFEIAAPADNVVSPGISGVLQVNGGVLMIGAGALSLPGEIDLLGGSAMMQTAGPTLTLVDFGVTGSILLEGGSFGGRIVGGGGTGTLDTVVNLSSTIHGSGFIGTNLGFLDQLNIHNSATIAADIPGLQLVLNDYIANDGGQLIATGGGVLDVSGGIDQTALSGFGTGAIVADDNSTVVLDKATVIAGDLVSTASGTVRIGTKVTLDGVAVDAAVQLDSGATLDLTGFINSSSSTGSGGTINAGSGMVILNAATIVDVALIATAGHLVFLGNANVFTDKETFDTGLTIGHGQLVTFGDGSVFASIAPNLMVNPATIALAGSVLGGATLGINSSSLPVQLTGGGTVTLANTADLIAGTGAVLGTALLENVNNTIIGIGSIDNLATLTVDSGASIIASGGTLVLNATSIVSAGFLGAVAGSTLDILGKLTNTGKLGGLVVFGGPGAGLVNGTLAAGATIEIGAPGAAFDAITNNGTIIVDPGATLTLTGTTHNTGIIQLNGLGADHASVEIGGTLNGGGTITFGPGDVVNSLGSTQFVNVDNVIQGSGNLGTGKLSFLNHWIINANVAGNPLTVDPTAPTVQNLGLMEATAGGTLAIVGDLINAGSGIGTLLASGAGSVVALLGGSVALGLLNSTGGGQIQVQAAETLLLGGLIILGTADVPPFASPSALSNYADLRVLAGETLTLTGAALDPWLINYGTVGLHGTVDAVLGHDVGATLVIAAATVELSAPVLGVTSGGGGTLTLGNAADRVIGANGADILNNSQTIMGFGQLGAGALILRNSALIEATGATAPLVINSNSTFDNQGTLAIGPGAGGNMVLEGFVADTGIMVNLGGSGAFVLGGTDRGGTLIGANIESGVRVTSSPFGSTIDGAVNSGTIDALFGQTLAITGQLNNFGLVNASGKLTIDTSESFVNNNSTLRASVGGELDVNGAGGIDNSNAILAAGGTVVVAGAVTDFGQMMVDAGKLVLNGAVDAGQTIRFLTGYLNPETLVLGDVVAMAGRISSFYALDTIDLVGITADAASDSSGSLLTVTNAGSTVATLNLSSLGFAFKVIPDGAGGSDVVVACFASGTHILTDAGEVPVETLRAGDAVATVRRGKLARVKWLGHRHVDCRRHPDPRAVWPIRVQAGAFGPATPHADLLLSPDHAVFIDGRLIPIRYLVNGRSIAREERDEVTYWHVELSSHDILLAEGLPAESYLDTGNRGAFTGNAGVTRMHPDFALRVWQAEGCAPLVVEGAGLRAARGHLLDRAALLGHAMTGDAELRLLVDGHVLRPSTIAGMCRFRLPAAARDVRLLSRSAMPAHTHDDGGDERCLGVAVSRLVLDRRPIALDDPRLGSGWHGVEFDAAGRPCWRWTTGDAALAITGPVELDIEVAMTARYWAEPPPAADAAAQPFHVDLAAATFPAASRLASFPPFRQTGRGL